MTPHQMRPGLRDAPGCRALTRVRRPDPGYNRPVSQRCGGLPVAVLDLTAKGASLEQAEEGRHSEASGQAEEDGREAPHVDARPAPVSDQPSTLLLAVVDDLFVRSRIDAAAGQTGVEV